MKNIQKILIIDDDPDIGIALQLLLEYKGFESIISQDGLQVEEILQDQNIGLVILDLLISGVNGAVVCRRLKDDPLTAHIPILMFSALSNAEKTCRDAGADDFVYKPFEMNTLLLKIKHSLH